MYFRSRDLENETRFLTTFMSATSFRIWTLSAFLYISETTRTKPILRTGQKSACFDGYAAK